jgi:dihydrofolate reductase
MGKVILDISMSLDGFITATNVRLGEGLGDDGQILHKWAFNSDDPRNHELMKTAAGLGALIAGRNTYDISIPWWEADGPTGPARIPLIVVSHSVPETIPDGGVYTFADSIETSLERAREAAGDKDIAIMGGANIAQQFLKEGLVDEISLHLAPVIFGNGTQLFENLGNEHIQLETPEVTETPESTHLRFRVVK